jgi:hypothetical protein
MKAATDGTLAGTMSYPLAIYFHTDIDEDTNTMSCTTKFVLQEHVVAEIHREFELQMGDGAQSIQVKYAAKHAAKFLENLCSGRYCTAYNPHYQIDGVSTFHNVLIRHGIRLGPHTQGFTLFAPGDRATQRTVRENGTLGHGTMNRLLPPAVRGSRSSDPLPELNTTNLRQLDHRKRVLNRSNPQSDWDNYFK